MLQGRRKYHEKETLSAPLRICLVAILLLLLPPPHITAANKELKDLNNGKAGDGFTYRSISIRKDEFGDAEILGEMENQSGKDYGVVMFSISLYDKEKEVIGHELIMITEFKDDSKRTFKEPILNVLLDKIAIYKIDFNGGVS